MPLPVKPKGQTGRGVTVFCGRKCSNTYYQKRHIAGSHAELVAWQESRTCDVCGVSIAWKQAAAKSCSVEHRNWANHHPGKIWGKPEPKQCLGCGTDLTGTLRAYCGNYCYQWHQKNPETLRPLVNSGECMECGTSLSGKRLDAKFCDSSCAGRYNKARARAAGKNSVVEWSRKNPDKVANHRGRRRAREQGAGYINVTPKDWQSILRQYRWSCAYCLRKVDELAQEHVIPLCKGGRHAPANLVPACKSCNSRKGRMLLAEWRLYMRKRRPDREVAAFQRKVNEERPAA